MKFKCIILAVLAFLPAVQIWGQTFSIKFSAIDSEDSHYQLDSVQVLNMSQGWATTLHYPDTILNLTVGTSGIRELSDVSSAVVVMSAYPNPTKGRTSICVYAMRETTASVKLYRIDGTVLAELKATLAAGGNRIEVNPGGSGIFFVQVATGDGEQGVAKFVSLGENGVSGIALPVPYASPTKGENSGPFTTSDIMRITGYATFQDAKIESEPVVGNIASDRTITFALPIYYSAPVVATSEVTDVTMTGAKCGGTVVSDGGKPVTTRGVCYSAEGTPTIEDNITTDGEGMGTFVTYLENLEPGTTYFLRAYAFNSLGFAYGEIVSFSTPISGNDPSEDGCLPGRFSIGDSQQVMFSKGNLQYSTIENHLTATPSVEPGTWRFAETQYMYIGDGNASAGENYNGFIDLFGWGTSGWNSGVSAYQPYSTSTINDDYLTMYDLNGTNADWGRYNAIQNGGNQPGMWRVLSSEEWQYLLNDSNERRSGRNAQATLVINGDDYHGVLLLPDSFELPAGCQYTAGYANGFSTNIYTQEQWEMMEQAGAVFLVAAGRRNGNALAHQNERCLYWSGTHGDGYSSSSLYVVSGAILSDGVDQVHMGLAVRLVRTPE